MSILLRTAVISLSCRLLIIFFNQYGRIDKGALMWGTNSVMRAFSIENQVPNHARRYVFWFSVVVIVEVQLDCYGPLFITSDTIITYLS
jgi:hypothetical protein